MIKVKEKEERKDDDDTATNRLPCLSGKINVREL